MLPAAGAVRWHARPSRADLPCVFGMTLIRTWVSKLRSAATRAADQKSHRASHYCAKTDNTLHRATSFCAFLPLLGGFHPTFMSIPALSKRGRIVSRARVSATADAVYNRFTSEQRPTWSPPKGQKERLQSTVEREDDTKKQWSVDNSIFGEVALHRNTL